MLALTAVTIGTLAHSSSSEALRARQAEHDLQARWAEASSRRVLLPLLQKQLESALDRWRTVEQDISAPPPSSITVSIDLGDQRIVARVEDQQSLPNLNQLLLQTENGQIRDVRNILAENAIRERQVPRPLDQDHARRLGIAPYESWGQLYPAASPETLSGLTPGTFPPHSIAFNDAESAQTGVYVGTGVTLWGNGKLNVWTASPEALHRVLDNSIGADQTVKLIGLREDYRDLSARQLVQMMNLAPSERAAARLALTDRSQTFAMWLAITPLQDGEPILDGRVRWSLTTNDENGRSPQGQVRGQIRGQVRGLFHGNTSENFRGPGRGW